MTNHNAPYNPTMERWRVQQAAARLFCAPPTRCTSAEHTFRDIHTDTRGGDLVLRDLEHTLRALAIR